MNQSDTEQWVLVPSLNDKYEITRDGRLRNARTKRIIKLGNDRYTVTVGLERIEVLKDKLLEEVFGVPFVPPKPRARYVPCIVEKGGKSERFNLLGTAAAFIAAETHFSHSYVMAMFKRREPVVFGFNVTYLDKRGD